MTILKNFKMGLFRKHIFYLFLCFYSIGAVGQFEDLELNTTIYTDTIQAVMYEHDEEIFFRNSYDCAFSNSNTLYLSDRQKGLYKIDISLPETFKGESYKVNEINHRGALKIFPMGNSILVGTQQGLYLINEKENSIKQLGQEDPNWLNRYEGGAAEIEALNDSLFLIGNTEGMFVYNLKSDKVHKDLMHENPERDGWSTKYYTWDLQRDPDDPNVMWGIDRLGLFRLSLDSFEQVYIGCPIQKDYEWPYRNMTDLIVKDEFIYIFHRQNKFIRYNRKNGTWKLLREFKVKAFPDRDSIRGVLRNMYAFKEHIYIGSRFFGPMVYHIESEQFHQIYVSHPRLNQIESDWESRTYPLYRYLHNASWSTFDNYGFLWIGTDSEYLYRSKNSFFKNSLPKPLQIRIKDFFIRNQEKNLGNKFSDKGTTIDLKTDQREVALSFGLINPNQDSLEYFYKLNNQDWSESLGRNLIRLNLDGGSSILELEIRKNDEIIAQRAQELNVEKYWYEKIWIWILSGLTLFTIVYLFYRNRVKQIRKEESLKSDFNKRIAEIEMQALRAQMNPHFLFNSLNSIKHYTLNKSKDEAADYLTTFSLLIRQVLQNSNEKVITLAQEIEAIKLYVEVEQKRFEDKFEFHLDVDENLNAHTVYVPPLLIQPYVENAIWHGLMHLKSPGNLIISINEDQDKLHCIVQDNGVGRAQALAIKKAKEKYKKKSLGTKITSDRLKWTKEVYGVEAKVEIEDLKDESGLASGTRVLLELPKISKQTIEQLRES